MQAFVRENGVQTIFVEPNVSNKIATVVADATDTEIVELSPLESDPHNDLTYLENLNVTLETLSQQLAKEEQNEQ